MAAPVAVVGEEYVVPSRVGLKILRQNRNYNVVDSDGNNVFIVTRHVDSMHKRYDLLDASAGKTLVTLRMKVLTLHDRWQVFRGDSADEDDLLFTVKSSSAIQLMTKLHVYLGKNINEDVWDFCLKCNWLRDSCAIYYADNTVAQMSSYSETFKDIWTTKDHFDVNVYPNIDSAFIVALIVILDATQMMYRTRAKNANNLRKFFGVTHPILENISFIEDFMSKFYNEHRE